MKDSRDFLTPSEVKLLGTAPDAAIAKRLGRTVKAIESARLRRGIPSHRVQRVAARWKKWDRLLGKIPDTHIAAKMGEGTSVFAVLKRRRKLGIPAVQ